MSRLEDYGIWAAFGLTTTAKVVEKIHSLAGKATEVIGKRQEGYKITDPEIIAVDTITEELILGEIEKAGIEAIVLSEEAGRVEINKGKASKNYPEKVYIIVDPFDGSSLYRRQIPAFWYTAFSIYSLEGKPLWSVVADVNANTVDFANEKQAYTAKLTEESIADVRLIKPSTITRLADAYIELYLMKPTFLYPTVPKFEPLLGACKFVLPNAGPAGWADVAAGRVDVYLALREAGTEVFSGLPIAEKAGAVITTFAGEPVTFQDNLTATYAVACSSNEKLHEEVLEKLAEGERE